MDRPESSDCLKTLRELIQEAWPILPVSTLDNSGLEELKRTSFEALEIICVYRKKPGKLADRDQPFTLRRHAA